MLVKQSFVGIQNSFVVTGRDLESWRLQLADAVRNTAGGELGPGTVQTQLTFSVLQRCV